MIGLVPFLEAVVAFIVIAGTVEHGISLWLRHRASVSHPILLFQEGRNRHLDLAIWFQEVRFLRQPCRKFPLRTSSQGGKRWWDAFYADDPRTKRLGIIHTH